MTDFTITLLLSVLIALLNTMFWSLFATGFFLFFVFVVTLLLCQMVIRI